VTSKVRWFWPLAVALLLTDCATKRAAEHRLAVGEPRPVVGEVVRFTLSYNTNAAMGLPLGGDSRRFVLSAGVVDFIDVGVSHVRFWTFNVADMGITAGAVLLLLALGWKTRGTGLSRSPLSP